MNQERCRSSPPPTPPITSSAADLDVGEPDRRVAVGIVVGEGRVVDDLDPGTLRVDHEQGREPLAAVDHVRHDDVDGGDVAGGHEPLLAVEPEAVARSARRGGRDPDGSEPASRSVTA